MDKSGLPVDVRDSQSMREPVKKNSIYDDKKGFNFDVENGESPERGTPERRVSRDPSIADQAREFLSWTMTDVFDWNPGYAKQPRGILNLVHLFLSMLVLSLIGSACRMQPYVDTETAGFYCKTSDTFMFVVACSSLFTSLIHNSVCLLSKKSENRLLSTSFEITYYVVYCVLFFLGSISLISNVTIRNKDREVNEVSYNSTVAGAVFGLFNAIVYCSSAVWFYIYHKKYHTPSE